MADLNEQDRADFEAWMRAKGAPPVADAEWHDGLTCEQAAQKIVDLVEHNTRLEAAALSRREEMNYGRAEFEMYAANLGMHDFEGSQDDADRYRNPFTQERWNFWRASRDAMRGY